MSHRTDGSFASGVLFALGGYWHTLTGAILSLAASILDGYDGEVARSKLMESDFGCWLETVCDYLYYLLLFVALTLGLEKTSGSKAYFIGCASPCSQEATPGAKFRDPADLIKLTRVLRFCFPARSTPADSRFRNASRFLE